MPEIYSFPIREAYAQLDGDALTVTLHYPANPAVEARRLPENPEFGIRVLDELMTKGRARIAMPECPIKPASGGMLYIFDDGAILFHRRDERAPTHPLCHSAPAGYANTREHVYSADGMLQTCLREAAEENMLFTPCGGCLYVPREAERYITETAKNLGLDMGVIRTKPLDLDFLPGRDRLVVKDENGDVIFTVNDILLEALWATQTSLNVMRVAAVPFESSEMVPISTECAPDGKGGYTQFNRESFVAPLPALDGVAWGDVLDIDEIRVYANHFIQMDDGKIPKPNRVTATDYQEPYRMNDIGSDKLTEATHPQVFCPEDLLCRCLDEIGVEGYDSRWMEIEKWKETERLEHLQGT